MSTNIKFSILILALFSVIGCKKDGTQNESNLEIESYSESSFSLVDESVGSAASIEELSNDEYLLLGEDQETEIFFNVQLTKIDSDCSKLWTKSYGGPDNDFAKQVLKVNNGLMLICGTRNMALGAVDFLTIRTDDEGEELWSENYGEEYNDHPEEIIELEDGSFMIFGYSTNSNVQRKKYLIRIDEDGEEIWSKEGDFSVDDEGRSMAKSDTDEFLLLGTKSMLGEYDRELEIEKIDIDGNSIWLKQYESIERLFSHSEIIKSNEGGFMVVSTQSSGPNNNDHDILILKINEDGDKEWSKTYGGDKGDRAASIIQTSNNDYLILGNTASYGNGDNDIILIKIDESGEQLWAKTYGGSQYDSGNDLIERENGEILVCGGTKGDSGNMDYDLLVLKLDADGNPI